MFANPLMLAGLGGAVVPLALHLLSRAQYKRVQWGAMMFLQEDAANELRSARVKRWTLLGLRTLAIGLLAVALARPMIDSGVTDDARCTAAIVVDCSASMGYDEGGRTRMDLARGAVLQILSGLKRGDQAVLVVAGSPPSGARARQQQVSQPSTDLQTIAARVADLEVTPGPANLPDAMTAALNLLDREPLRKRQLYVVCDRQAANWINVTDSFVSAWRDRLAKTSAGLNRFVIVPVGGEGSANVAIESMSMAAMPVVRGITNRIEVTLRNYGDQPRVSVPVTLALGQQELLATTVNLPQRATVTVGTPITFPLTGSQVVTATVKARGITGDDRLDAVVNVVDPIRTLIVSSGTPTAATADDAAQYARAALSPYRSAQRRGNDPASVDVIGAGELSAARLAGYQVLVLADVDRPVEESAKSLDRFVSGGGGLLIAVGDRTQPDAYNAALYKNGVGLLPASLGAIEDEPLDAPFQLESADHPVFRFVAGSEADGFPSGAVRRRFASTPAAAAQVLARLASGDPLLIERSYGRGRVMLLTTGLGTEWGALPRTSFYVPFVQSIVRYLAATSADRRNISVGEEIVATLPQPPEPKATITLPDGTTAPCDVVTLEGRTQVRFTGTQQAGTYLVRVKIGAVMQMLPFVVRASNDESDLSPLPPEKWERLATSLQFTRVDHPEDAAPQTAAAPVKALWLPLMLVVIGVLMLEMGLGRWWST